MNEMDPCVLDNKPEELREAITCNPELIFQYGGNH
jgi:hypothetical protein